MRETFTFRDVMLELHIPMNNENNWAMGHSLQRFAKSNEVEPQRLLTQKTDPNPKVKAPHVIAHYPMRFWEDTILYMGDYWNDIRPFGDGGEL